LQKSMNTAAVNLRGSFCSLRSAETARALKSALPADAGPAEIQLAAVVVPHDKAIRTSGKS
jgi:hypothetical protein